MVKQKYGGLGAKNLTLEELGKSKVLVPDEYVKGIQTDFNKKNIEYSAYHVFENYDCPTSVFAAALESLTEEEKNNFAVGQIKIEAILKKWRDENSVFPSYISLDQNGRNLADFNEVESIMQNITKGVTKENIFESEKSYERRDEFIKNLTGVKLEHERTRNIIYLEQRITQSIVADFIKEYMSIFKNVTIPFISFKEETPLRLLMRSGIPTKKLILK